MKLVRLAAVAAAALTLVACGGGGAATPTEGAAALEVTDPWVKATDETEEATGAFGTFTNNSAADIHIVSASADGIGMVQIHEFIEEGGVMVMSEMADGFVIPANGEYVLEPGANHIMLMGLNQPLEAGTEVAMHIQAEDGSEFSWTAQVRTFTGAQDSYGSHGDMSMTPSPSESDG